MAADIIRDPPKHDKEFYLKISCTYERYFRNTPIEQKPTIENFDNYLYCWAVKVWPRALDRIYETCRR